MVPLFADGPAAGFVAGARDNADLGKRLKWLASLDGESADGQPDAQDAKLPRNIVLVLSDGGGLPALSAASYVDGKLAVTSLPRRGLLATSSEDRLVPDPAAAATALASGRSTVLNAVGLAPEGGELIAVPTLFELAESSGMRTGLVTTATLTDTTLAAFYAHHRDSRQEEHNAAYLAGFGTGLGSADGIDVAFGGGRDHFDPSVLDEWRQRGARVEDIWLDDPGTPGEPLVRLVATGDLAPASERLAYATEPTLAEMTAVALETLLGADEGFVLVIHAGGLAEALARYERGQALVDEVIDLDRAAEAALRFAWERDDTLLVVTATRDATLSLLDNHYPFHKGHCGIAQRCGGPEVLLDLPVAWQRVHNGAGLGDARFQGEFTPPGLILQYAWLPQRASRDADLPEPGSANFVPLFAYGPGANALKGFHHAAEVGELLIDWVNR
jgi:alkaline phosphatase